ncbi:MAG: hypothetical protein WC498_00500 [Candidatus Saccharimonadales bacterium]
MTTRGKIVGITLTIVLWALALRSIYTLSVERFDMTLLHYVKAVLLLTLATLTYNPFQPLWRRMRRVSSTDNDGNDSGQVTVSGIALAYVCFMVVMTFVAIWPASAVVHGHIGHAQILFFKFYALLVVVPVIVAWLLSKLPAKKIAEFHR